MTGEADHYDVYYADKLWNLLPAIYRTLGLTAAALGTPSRIAKPVTKTRERNAAT